MERSMEAAGVVARASEACRHCKQTYCDDLDPGRSCVVGSRIRGGILARVVSLRQCTW
jgi:hypothetical protein